MQVIWGLNYSRNIFLNQQNALNMKIIINNKKTFIQNYIVTQQYFKLRIMKSFNRQKKKKKKKNLNIKLILKLLKIA